MGELQKRLRSVRSKVWGTNDYAPDSLCCAAADALDAQDAELGRCQAEIARLRGELMKAADGLLTNSQALLEAAERNHLLVVERDALRARCEAAEAQIRTRVFGVCGYLSGRIPELHAVDCARLIEAAEEYLRDAARGGA